MSVTDIAGGRQLHIDIERATVRELREELRRIAPVYREACTMMDLIARDHGGSASMEYRDRLTVAVAHARGEQLPLNPGQLAHLLRPVVELGDPPAPAKSIAPTPAPDTNGVDHAR